MTGIDYPTVTIDGQELTVRFSFLAQYLMSLHGVILQPMASSTPGYLANRLQMFADAVAETAPDPSKAPDAAHWAARIELYQWGEIEVALGRAMGKAAEELRRNIQVVTPPVALAS